MTNTPMPEMQTPMYQFCQSTLPSGSGAMRKETIAIIFSKMSSEVPKLSLKGGRRPCLPRQGLADGQLVSAPKKKGNTAPTSAPARRMGQMSWNMTRSILFLRFPM